MGRWFVTAVGLALSMSACGLEEQDWCDRWSAEEDAPAQLACVGSAVAVGVYPAAGSEAACPDGVCAADGRTPLDVRVGVGLHSSVPGKSVRIELVGGTFSSNTSKSLSAVTDDAGEARARVVVDHGAASLTVIASYGAAAKAADAGGSTGGQTWRTEVTVPTTPAAQVALVRLSTTSNQAVAGAATPVQATAYRDLAAQHPVEGAWLVFCASEGATLDDPGQTQTGSQGAVTRNVLVQPGAAGPLRIVACPAAAAEPCSEPLAADGSAPLVSAPCGELKLDVTPIAKPVRSLVVTSSAAKATTAEKVTLRVNAFASSDFVGAPTEGQAVTLCPVDSQTPITSAASVIPLAANGSGDTELTVGKVEAAETASLEVCAVGTACGSGPPLCDAVPLALKPPEATAGSILLAADTADGPMIPGQTRALTATAYTSTTPSKASIAGAGVPVRACAEAPLLVAPGAAASGDKGTVALAVAVPLGSATSTTARVWACPYDQACPPAAGSTCGELTIAVEPAPATSLSLAPKAAPTSPLKLGSTLELTATAFSNQSGAAPAKAGAGVPVQLCAEVPLAVSPPDGVTGGDGTVPVAAWLAADVTAADTLAVTACPAGVVCDATQLEPGCASVPVAVAPSAIQQVVLALKDPAQTTPLGLGGQRAVIATGYTTSPPVSGATAGEGGAVRFCADAPLAISPSTGATNGAGKAEAVAVVTEPAAALTSAPVWACPVSVACADAADSEACGEVQLPIGTDQAQAVVVELSGTPGTAADPLEPGGTANVTATGYVTPPPSTSTPVGAGVLLQACAEPPLELVADTVSTDANGMTTVQSVLSDVASPSAAQVTVCPFGVTCGPGEPACGSASVHVAPETIGPQWATIDAQGATWAVGQPTTVTLLAFGTSAVGDGAVVPATTGVVRLCVDDTELAVSGPKILTLTDGAATAELVPLGAGQVTLQVCLEQCPTGDPPASCDALTVTVQP